MNKILILGGGVAGLSAGIYCQRYGYRSEIYEKNPVLGGECITYKRQGYVVDNCIHWLTGVRPSDTIYKVWRETGVIDDATGFIHEPYLYRLHYGETCLTLWTDREKARQELLAFAPEDSGPINAFFEAVQRSECVAVPCEKSLAKMSFIGYMKIGKGMRAMLPVLKTYGKMSIGQLAASFKNPAVAALMRGYFNDDYKALILVTSYAFYTSGMAALPLGGSKGLIERMKATYLSLGGQIHLAEPALKINVVGKKAVSVAFAKETIPCVGVIAACDPEVTFSQLLDDSYRAKALRQMKDHRKDRYLLASCFTVSYGIEGSEDYGLEPGSVSFRCAPYNVGGKTFTILDVRLYADDPELFPKDKRVIRSIILQDENCYDYWEKLYQNKEVYAAEKKRIATLVQERILKQYPLLAGHLKLIDSYSPITFTRYCGAYRGSYMAYFERSGGKSLTAKNTIKGLKNVFLASQVLTTSGGLPMAVTSGKFAADEVKHAIKKR